MSSRGESLLQDGIEWIAQGGVLDFTADGDNESETLKALLLYDSKGVNLSHVTISTDAYG